MDLKKKLIDAGHDEQEVGKFLAHLHDVRNANKPINVTDTYAYSAYAKVTNLGIPFDGVSAVFTGQKMFMVTADGYKNRVLKTYPETEIDMQLVREGDKFQLAKESGSVVYSHTIANPFEDKEIEGAYVVMKNKRGEFIETLNKADFEKMKNASKQGYLWKTWASEFWLKSVVKRACKRHFKDIITEIDKLDNEYYGLKDQEATKEQLDDIVESHKNS